MPRKSSYSRPRSAGKWHGKRPGRRESRMGYDYSNCDSLADCQYKANQYNNVYPVTSSNKNLSKNPDKNHKKDRYTVHIRHYQDTF
jgi:hypothetical protein